MINENIEIIYDVKCPHCSKNIKAALKMDAPAVSWVESADVIKKVKEELLKKIESLNMDDDQKKSFREWLSDPSTCVRPEDVEKTLSELSK